MLPIYDLLCVFLEMKLAR